MNAKISAIIPCYNTKKDILSQCIDSILQQDYQNFEIIIVNDGSDDPYVNDIQEIAKLDSRIIVVNQDNQGVSAARNNGLKKASGEYITFIDSDDKVVPYFFSEAYYIAKENDADYIVGCVYPTRTREPVIPRRPHPSYIVKGSKEYRPYLINIKQKFSNGSYFGRGSVARLVKRSILDGVSFQEDLKLGEDIIWNLDVISKCDKIYMVKQIWYLYWENQESVTCKYNPHIVPICEKHLHSLLKRIDINDEKELTEYCLHIGELLRDYVFGCYYGNAKCTFSIFKRNALFCKLCQQNPWAFYQKFFSRVNYDWKTKAKCLLINFRLLYWLYFILDFIDRKHKSYNTGER